MISFCGLVCDECGAFLATKSDDDEKRKEIAESWSKMYDAGLKPEDINCRGCVSDGAVVFAHCKVCEIRKCGMEKGVQNCAYCEEYVCDKLEKFFEMVPDAKKLLDEIKAGM
jgi:hypothetical protein